MAELNSATVPAKATTLEWTSSEHYEKGSGTMTLSYSDNILCALASCAETAGHQHVLALAMDRFADTSLAGNVC